MSLSPALFAYLSLSALKLPAVRRRLSADVAKGLPDAARQLERLGQPGLRRPEGQLVWLHLTVPEDAAPAIDLARRLGEILPKAALLVTSDTPLPGNGLPAPILHQYVPFEASAPVAGFLDHWRPDVCLWVGAGIRPALIHSAAEAGCRMMMVDARGAPAELPGVAGWRGLCRSTLGLFETVLATDGASGAALAEAGVRRTALEISGPLAEDAAPLPCNPRERDAIAETLNSRPVWLCVGVTEAEEGSVVSAHRSAARLAHRLMLILSPANPARGPILAQKLAIAGLSVALRSSDGEPEAGTDVLIADSEGDLGLLYRLAPITFLGGTLDPAGGGGRSPLEPAALGSAILHGPHVGPHEAAYARFRAAKAARRVTTVAELGAALSELLSPDRAAAMAHAAWAVSTESAETVERISTLVQGALAQRQAR